MKNFGSVNEVLDFAIAREEESYAFYMDLAEKVKKDWVQDLFRGFALEEKSHRAKLEEVKKGNLLLSAEKKVADLKIADYLVEAKPSPEMDLQQALVLAMQKEKAAFRLYTDLANSASDDNLKTAFVALAQEEAKHKLRFEIIYDDEILTEN